MDQLRCIPMLSSPVMSEMRLGYSRGTGLKVIHGGSAIWRVAVLATAALVCVCESAGPSVSPTLVTSERISAEPLPTTPGPTTTAPTIGVAPPRPSPCSRPMPSLFPALVSQNGNLDVNVPFRLGLIRFFLLPCRDIEVVRGKYGLGPATRVIPEPPDPTAIPTTSEAATTARGFLWARRRRS